MSRPPHTDDPAGAGPGPRRPPQRDAARPEPGASLPVDRRTRPRGRLRIMGDALYGVLRIIARRAHSFYGALVAYLSVSFFVGLAAVWGFAAISGRVLAGATQRFDESVLTWVELHRTPGLNQAALEVTALGNTATVVVLVLCVSAFLWLTHHRLSVALLAAALAGGRILNVALKDVFGRPRPTVVEWETHVSSASFPSGHSMTAFIAYASVAYLVGRLEPTRTLRTLTWAFAALLILGIGASRIYLGVHYPSDVLGGYAAGLAWLAFVVSGITAIRYFSDRSPEPVEEERDLHAEDELAEEEALEEAQEAVLAEEGTAAEEEREAAGGE